MNRSESRTWAVAALISLTVHGMLIWQVRADSAESAGHGTPTTTITRVRFNTSGAAPSAVTTQVERPPVEKAKPRKIEKGAAAANLIKEAEQEETAEQSPAGSVAPVSGNEQSNAPVPGASSLAEARQVYQSQVLAHIERHKFYPEAARRRGATGGVRVTFLVAEGGSVSGLECGAGPAMLAQAACESVRRSVPLPKPPDGLSFPISMSFVMEFALK